MHLIRKKLFFWKLHQVACVEYDVAPNNLATVRIQVIALRHKLVKALSQ
jgi:hypothetical protein